MARFFDTLAKKSSRGKAKQDEFGRSARKRAFGYFYQGLRPSQLPPLGVKRMTLYRYFQAWKHRGQEFIWSALKRTLIANPERRQELAAHLGISEDELMAALKHSRNAAQFRRALRVEEAQQLEEVIEAAKELDLERLIVELRRCPTLQEKKAKLQEGATRMGITAGELILMLEERNKRLRAEAVLQKSLVRR